MSGAFQGLRLAWDIWRAGRGSPQAVEARQRERLAELVAFARGRSSFYREHYAGLPSTGIGLADLPPVTKPQLMARFDDWVTDPAVTLAGVRDWVANPENIGGWYLRRYLVWTTSGTTGVPALLVQDRRAWAVYTALAYVRGLLAWVTPRDLWEILRRGGRSAALLVTGGHYGGVVMVERRRRERPWRAKLVRVFSVQSPLPELVRELNAFQPALLGGYATALALLAQEQAVGRLRIHPVLMVSSAESLALPSRQRIAAAFGCPLWDGYGASEVAAIALDCGHGWLHVNADWVIVEPVDAEHRPVPPGEPSRTVLVTNLANRVQPIIRYDLGDSMTVSPEPCPCGSPLPAIRVEGRTDEVLALRAPSGETVRLLPLALATVVEQTPHVYRFQIIQTAADRLTVRLETTLEAESGRVWSAVEERLRAYLAQHGLPNVAVERAPEPPRRDPRSGKFRQVWAEADPPLHTGRSRD